MRADAARKTVPGSVRRSQTPDHVGAEAGIGGFWAGATGYCRRRRMGVHRRRAAAPRDGRDQRQRVDSDALSRGGRAPAGRRGDVPPG